MPESTASVPDPFALWREWVSNSEHQWNTFLNDAMSTDQFSQSMARFMDVYLNLQKGLNETMGRYLSALNIPTRGDVTAIADRLSLIEERLGGIEARLAPPLAAAPQHTASTPASSLRPPRTKQPSQAVN